MKFKEYLAERTQDVVFHYTHVMNVLSMLKNDKIRLTYDGGTGAEQQFTQKGKPYFFSVARSPLGDYGKDPGMLYCNIKLSGRAFNDRFKSKAVDYWGREFRQTAPTKHEMEDRIYHSEPYITDVKRYIQEVHIYLPDQNSEETRSWEKLDDKQKSQLRKFMLEAKKMKIPYWFYADKNSWKTRDKRKAITIKPSETKVDDVSKLQPGWSPGWKSLTRKELDILKELYYKNKKSELSDKARKKAYDMQYDYYRKDIKTSYKNDFHNNKRDVEKNGIDGLVKIMRKVKKERIEDFIDYLADKWKDEIMGN